MQQQILLLFALSAAAQLTAMQQSETSTNLHRPSEETIGQQTPDALPHFIRPYESVRLTCSESERNNLENRVDAEYTFGLRSEYKQIGERFEEINESLMIYPLETDVEFDLFFPKEFPFVFYSMKSVNIEKIADVVHLFALMTSKLGYTLYGPKNCSLLAIEALPCPKSSSTLFVKSVQVIGKERYCLGDFESQYGSSGRGRLSVRKQHYDDSMLVTFNNGKGAENFYAYKVTRQNETTLRKLDRFNNMYFNFVSK